MMGNDDTVAASDAVNNIESLAIKVLKMQVPSIQVYRICFLYGPLALTESIADYITPCFDYRKDIPKIGNNAFRVQLTRMALSVAAPLPDCMT
jgi:hypothetical protein